MPSSRTRLEPIVRFGALLRTSASFTSCRWEYDERWPARSSWRRTPAMRLPPGSLRSDHERQIEAGVSRAAVEIQPFGPRFGARRNVGNRMKAIERHQRGARIGRGPRRIRSGIGPRLIDRGFGIADRALEAGNPALCANRQRSLPLPHADTTSRGETGTPPRPGLRVRRCEVRSRESNGPTAARRSSSRSPRRRRR